MTPSPLGRSWVNGDARRLLGELGHSAVLFNVYSAGDSGEGCEVIEFTAGSAGGRSPWTARIVALPSGRRCVTCTPGWV